MAVKAVGWGLQLLLSLSLLAHCATARPGVVDDLESQIVPNTNRTSNITSNSTTVAPVKGSSVNTTVGIGNATVAGSNGNSTKNGTVTIFSACNIL